MRILIINVFQCTTPFKFSFHSPHTRRLRSDSIVVELHFDNNISGYGEGAARPYVTGETPATLVYAIRDYFSNILLRREINSIEDVQGTIEALEKNCLNRNNATYNSALAAIDVALLDALSQYQGVPLHSYFGPVVTDKLPCSFSVPFLKASELKQISHRVIKLSIDSMKVIMGKVEKENIERVKLVRSLFGTEIGIRVEANGKWQAKQAISQIEKLKRFNISGVEQPVAAADIDGLKEVRDKTGIPIIVDESMCSLSDAKKLIEEKACDIINIKISKCGGLLRSKEIRDFAVSRNIPCQVGAHVGETDILGRAGRHFAMTTRNLFCFEGFSHLLFEDSWDDHFLRKNDSKKAMSNPGLGVDLTKQRLKLICSLENKR